MRRVANSALLVALPLAALAFGGTEPYSLALATLLLYFSGAWCAVETWRVRRDADSPAAWLVCALLLAVPVGQLVFSRTLDKLETVSHALLLLACVCAFLAARQMASTPAGLNKLLIVFLLLGAAEGLYGLGQVLSGSPRVWHHLNEFARGNATGTYINRNHFALLMALLLPLAMAGALLAVREIRSHRSAAQTWRDRLASPDAPKLLLAFALVGVMCAALLASRSRMGVLAGGVAAGVAFLLLSRVRAEMLERRARPWPLAAALAAGLALALWAGGQTLFGRFALLPGELGATDAGRWSFWRGTVELISRAPLSGWGLGTFALAFPPQQTSHFHLSVSHAHNDYLQVAAETGLPAAALLFGAVFFLAARCARASLARERNFQERALAAGVAAAIAAMLFDALADFNFYVPANALIFCALLGMGSALSAPLQVRQP